MDNDREVSVPPETGTISMVEKRIEKKIKNFENDQETLEAFVLQSAAIESLLFAEIKLNLSLKEGDLKTLEAVKKQIDDYAPSQLIEFIFKTNGLSKEKIDLIRRYQKKRNDIVRNFVDTVPRRDFEKKVEEAYYIGKIIISFPEFSGGDKSGGSRGKQKSKPHHADPLFHAPAKQERKITDRENKILELRLEGDTYKEIGDKINVTRERVRQILNSAISRIEGTLHELRPIKSARETNARVNSLKRINVKNIISTICRTYDISRDDLLGNSRLAKLVFPRHLTIYFLRENLKLSFPRIAKIAGRDHSSAMHAYEKIRHLMKLEKIFIKPPGSAS